MVQAATFGIGFNEIMMVATVATLLLALIIPMGELNAEGVPKYDMLSLPGAFIQSFNELWFDNFSFFKSEHAGCASTIRGIGNTNSLAVATPANYTANESSSFLDQIIYRARMTLGIWKTSPTVANTPMATTAEIIGSADPLGSFISWTTSLLGLAWGIIFGCTLGAIRLVIGLSIAAYWFFKTIPLWQLLWNMFMAFIG